ncbi:MAG: hypothetical protein L6Q76_25070, partial [Polyangiaceae bacterium]|nr:hypothetical protein [Polyangiaceae bacterium]
SCLDKGWSTPADVFMHPSSAGEELRDGWGSRIGDISLAMRLRQWAKYGGDEAALEAVPYREQRTMLEARYRLTSVGHEIKRNGLSSLGQGPPQPIWGVTAYDPKDPWVVVNEDGERPHFERPGKRGGGS